MNVPAVPGVDPTLLQEHLSAHAQLHGALETVDPLVRRLFSILQHRLMVEALAYVQPVLSRPMEQLLLPPPRAFLTRTQELRMMGAHAAFRHIDSRVTMREMGVVDAVLQPSTPVVLHGLLEGMTPSARETNPGMLRATPTYWLPEVSTYMHPPAPLCPELVEEAVAVASDRSIPAAIRAGWLTFTMLSIHPFVDGNGRTSRSLFLAVACEGLPGGVDWGVLEQWSVARESYVAHLQQGQQVERYIADEMDAAPFVHFGILSSTYGANTCFARLKRLAELVDQHRQRGLDVEHSFVLATIQVLRGATWTDLRGCAFDAPKLDRIVTGLLDAGLIVWGPRPAARRTMQDPAQWALVAA